jgi:hypothetical protein
MMFKPRTGRQKIHRRQFLAPRPGLNSVDRVTHGCTVGYWRALLRSLEIVAGRMVADRKVWPDARTGAKGQRPTQGRAGAGLASPAGIGAGASLIGMA